MSKIEELLEDLMLLTEHSKAVSAEIEAKTLELAIAYVTQPKPKVQVAHFKPRPKPQGLVLKKRGQ